MRNFGVKWYNLKISLDTFHSYDYVSWIKKDSIFQFAKKNEEAVETF